MKWGTGTRTQASGPRASLGKRRLSEDLGRRAAVGGAVEASDGGCSARSSFASSPLLSRRRDAGARDT